MKLVQRLAYFLLLMVKEIYRLIPRGKDTIPTPNLFLLCLLDVAYGTDKLFKLEFLTDFYENYGLFRFDRKVYIFDPKLTQTAINKLEKGAEEYLKNSPLKDTFLGSSSRSPEVRRAIASMFRKNALEERGSLVIIDVQNMCDKMEQSATLGEPVNITNWSLRMAMDVVGHMLLELDLHAIEGEQNTLLECLVTILHRCYALGEIPVNGDEFKQANVTFENLTSKILEEALQKEEKAMEKRLVVKLYEACGFEMARDNMKLFLMAGSETTASTIPVVFSLLTSYPEIQEELRVEADTHLKDLQKDPSKSLPKIEAVLKEVLRIYPIAPFISRCTHERVQIGDVTLEPNNVAPIPSLPFQTDLIAFTWGIHRSPAQWSAAKQFEPFRFLSGLENSKHSMYIPFGAGSRICIGQHLAWLELKIATTVMLHRFRFSKLLETPDLRFAVDWAHAVVHPERDLWFKLEVLN